MRKPRLISAPPAKGGSPENGWSQLSGTMGAYSPDNGPIGNIPAVLVPDTRFEAPEDLNYERMIADRERELGLPATPNGVSGAAHHAPVAYREQLLPGPVTYMERPLAFEPITDLSALPDQFTLAIERKGDKWKITAPMVHSGLWKAGEDLSQVVYEALAALAEMVRIDGVKTKGRRK